MIIADSGSTKTTWADVESGKTVTTEGLNPYFSSDEQILAACHQVQEQLSTVNCQLSVVFYGAGCGDKQQALRMKSLLQQGFATEDVQVETDMLGACRSICDNEAGIVGILGTGSNACYYNGKTITIKQQSYGYILGDEGSANNVGRELLKKYLHNMLSSEVNSCFQKKYPFNYTELLDAVYNKPNPNRFLAQIATIAVQNINDRQCREIIDNALEQWFIAQISTLVMLTDCHRISIVGGFAKAIENCLKEKFKNYSLAINKVIANPIEGLLEYHRKQNQDAL